MNYYEPKQVYRKNADSAFHLLQIKTVTKNGVICCYRRERYCYFIKGGWYDSRIFLVEPHTWDDLMELL